MKYSKILIKLRSPTGRMIVGQVMVRDGFALSTFSDKNLARDLFETDLKKGEDVAFNEDHNAYIQKFKGLKKVQIIKQIKEELEKAGGTLKIV